MDSLTITNQLKNKLPKDVVTLSRLNMRLGQMDADVRKEFFA